MFHKKYRFPYAQFVIDGIRYRWSGWLGCQLESYEWRRPIAGTRRKLDIGNLKQPIEVTVFSTKRVGLRIQTRWAVSSSGTINEHTERIINLRNALIALI